MGQITKRITVIPMKNINGIAFNMNRKQVRQKLGNNPSTFKKNNISENLVDDFGFCHVYYDSKDICQAIEFFVDDKTIISINQKNIPVNKILSISNDFEETEPNHFVSKKLSIGVYKIDNSVKSVLFGKEGYYNNGIDKEQYIFKLRNLKTVVDRCLESYQHDYSSFGINPDVIKNQVIIPLADLLPQEWKSVYILISNIDNPYSFSVRYLMNTKTEDQKEFAKDSKNITTYMHSKYSKQLSKIDVALSKEFRQDPKLKEYSMILIFFNSERFNINYRYKNNPRKRINYDPTNLADPMNPMNPLNPANPISPMNPLNPVNPTSPMNPANQPQFMSFFKTYSKTINQEVQYAKNLSVNNADPKELQSHLESSMKILSKENEKIFSKIGPKVKVGSPEQANFLNKATKGLKSLLTKVKNNYHLESDYVMSNRSKVMVVLGICFIIVGIILCCTQGKEEAKKSSEIYEKLRRGETKDVHELQSLLVQRDIIAGDFTVNVVPIVVGILLLIAVFGNYLSLKDEENFYKEAVSRYSSFFKRFIRNTYYY